MNCRQFDSRLDCYLDGEIDAPRRAQMDGHAAGCPACRAQMEALRQAEHALRVPEFHAAPPGMLGEFHRRLDHTSRRPALAWPWAAGTALAAAAALAAFVMLPHPRPAPELPPSGEDSRIAGPKLPAGRPASPSAR